MKKNVQIGNTDRRTAFLLTLGIFLFYFIYSFFTFSMVKVAPREWYVSFAFFAIVEGIFCCVTRDIFVASVIGEIFNFFLYYIDSFVYSARLTHIRFNDLLAAGDGVAVMSHYPFPWNSAVAARFALLILIIMAQYVINKSLKQRSGNGILKLGIGLVIIPFLALTLYVSSGKYSAAMSTDEMFDYNGYFERKGLVSALFNQWLNSKVVEPEGYSSETAQRILTSYKEENKNNPDIDIVVIMNEAFTDYSLLGEIEYTDPLKNIHKEYGDTLFEGKLIVSVYGGVTCNTEYEFLTGNSLSFLPQDCIPFSQYIWPGQNSIAKDLSEQNFLTEGIHPYYSQEWNRKQNYQYLGFQKTIFGENFGNGLTADETNITNTHLVKLNFGDEIEYLRGFVSDRECYKKIISELEAAEENCFIFAVTIQNHGSYDYSSTDFVNESYTDNPEINQYLTCTKISDEAFRELTDYLSRRDRKTLVLMFGDHQPGLNMESYVEFSSQSDIINNYTVPFIFWSNFHAEYECPEILSANYLTAVLKQQAGVSLTAWDTFRLSAMEDYPVLYKQWVYLPEKGFVNIEAMDSKVLPQYRILTYHYQFE